MLDASPRRRSLPQVASGLARQRGMTLIELAVVLLVLIGLAGMLLPYVGGYAERTHDSANSNSAAELSAALTRYDAQYMNHPDNLDALLTWDGAAGTLINYFIANQLGSNPATAYGMAVRTLTAVAPGTAGPDAALCGSLRQKGMTRFKSMAQADAPLAKPPTSAAIPGTFSPTFNYYSGTDVNFLETGPCTGAVVELTDNAKIAQILGVSLQQITDKRALGHTFIALGAGPAMEANGRTIQEAPVHFASRGDVNAANAYNRFIAVYEVDGNNATACATCGGIDAARAAAAAHRATLAGTGMAMFDLLGRSFNMTQFYGRMTQ
jgi:type II secretory pathway pseudopilin PulG